MGDSIKHFSPLSCPYVSIRQRWLEVSLSFDPITSCKRNFTPFISYHFTPGPTGGQAATVAIMQQ